MAAAAYSKAKVNNVKTAISILTALLFLASCDLLGFDFGPPENVSIIGTWTRAGDGPKGIFIVGPDSTFESIVSEFGHAKGPADLEKDRVVLYGYICRGRPGEYRYAIEADTLTMTAIGGGCAYGLHGAWIPESVSIASS